MPLRLLRAGLIAFLPWIGGAADHPRPVCDSQNQGRLWPDAANHDPKLIPRLSRCGDLYICVRGTWHYHWEATSVRIDQLARNRKAKAAKPEAVCEAESALDAAPAPPSSNGN